MEGGPRQGMRHLRQVGHDFFNILDPDGKSDQVRRDTAFEPASHQRCVKCPSRSSRPHHTCPRLGQRSQGEESSSAAENGPPSTRQFGSSPPSSPPCSPCLLFLPPSPARSLSHPFSHPGRQCRAEERREQGGKQGKHNCARRGAVPGSEGPPCLRRQLGVRHRGRVLDERLDAA